MFLWLGHGKNGRAIAWLGYYAAVLTVVAVVVMLLLVLFC